MKSKHIIKLVFLFLAACFVIAGCKKDKKDAPVISKIRAVWPSPNDSVLSKAGPGETIVIQGENLASTLAIYFNGYAATFNAALFADDNIVVTIPADMPFASLDPTKLNTIRIITKYGETIFDFPIVPPPPAVNSMSNEMAVAGDRVTITGNNFFFVDKVIFPGNIEVTSNIVTNASGTTLEVTVPAGITQGGSIKVVNQYGTGTSLLLFNDHTTGMLCNFDNVSPLNNWNALVVINSTTAFPGGHGNYARFNFPSIGAGDWNLWSSTGRAIYCDPVSTWVPVAYQDEPASKWALKFEIYTRNPWNATGSMLMNTSDWTYTFAWEPWQGTGAFSSGGGWRTIVCPLSGFKKKANGVDGSGDPAGRCSDFLNASNKKFELYFPNRGSVELTNFDAALDNFRVVRISN